MLFQRFSDEAEELLVNFIRSLVVFSRNIKEILQSSLIFKHNVLFFFFFGILSFSKKDLWKVRLLFLMFSCGYQIHFLQLRCYFFRFCCCKTKKEEEGIGKGGVCLQAALPIICHKNLNPFILFNQVSNWFQI